MLTCFSVLLKESTGRSISLLIYMDCYLHFYSSVSFPGSCEIPEVEDRQEKPLFHHHQAHNHHKATSQKPQVTLRISPEYQGIRQRGLFAFKFNYLLSSGTTDSGKHFCLPVPLQPEKHHQTELALSLSSHSPQPIPSITTTKPGCKYHFVSFHYQVVRTDACISNPSTSVLEVQPRNPEGSLRLFLRFTRSNLFSCNTKILFAVFSFTLSAVFQRLYKKYHNRLNPETDMRIQLPSKKPDICKNVKQWYTPHYFKILDNVILF